MYKLLSFFISSRYFYTSLYQSCCSNYVSVFDPDLLRGVRFDGLESWLNSIYTLLNAIDTP